MPASEWHSYRETARSGLIFVCFVAISLWAITAPSQSTNASGGGDYGANATKPQNIASPSPKAAAPTVSPPKAASGGQGAHGELYGRQLIDALALVRLWLHKV